MRRIRNEQQGAPKDRGAALVEFAIAVPIFIALLALVFDAGLGYSSARTSSSSARTAARIGALAGDDRNADFLVLDSLRAQFGDGSTVEQIVIYKSDTANASGAVPGDCFANAECNFYPGSILAGLNESQFDDDDCANGDLDSNWCPLDRREDIGSFLGVFIKSTADATVGIGASEFDLEDRAVFAMYFPPEPLAP